MLENHHSLKAEWRAIFGDSDRCPECGAACRLEELGGALSVSCTACGERNCWTRDSLAQAGAAARFNDEEFARRRALAAEGRA